MVLLQTTEDWRKYEAVGDLTVNQPDLEKAAKAANSNVIEVPDRLPDRNSGEYQDGEGCGYLVIRLAKTEDAFHNQAVGTVL